MLSAVTPRADNGLPLKVRGASSSAYRDGNREFEDVGPSARQPPAVHRPGSCHGRQIGLMFHSPERAGCTRKPLMTSSKMRMRLCFFVTSRRAGGIRRAPAPVEVATGRFDDDAADVGIVGQVFSTAAGSLGGMMTVSSATALATPHRTRIVGGSDAAMRYRASRGNGPKLQHLRLARVDARQPKGHERRFGAGVDETNSLAEMRAF